MEESTNVSVVIFAFHFFKYNIKSDFIYSKDFVIKFIWVSVTDIIERMVDVYK